MKFLLIAIVLLFGTDSLFANSAPVVSNVTVSQRTDGSKLVDIRYNLYDADGDKCTVSVQVSSDGGNTWTVSAVSFDPVSAIGSNISAGTGKHIIWDCGADLQGVFDSNCCIKVTADDGQELFRDDFRGSLTWTRSDNSVYLKDNEYLYIGSGHVNNDYAERNFSIELTPDKQVVIEMRTKLSAGGGNYRLPNALVYFDDMSSISVTYLPDGLNRYGWHFLGWTTLNEPAVPGEDYWTLIKVVLTSTGGQLYMKRDDPGKGWYSEQYLFITSASWSHSQIKKIRFQQPWDSVNYVDYITIKSLAETSYGLSNIFTIDTINAITVSATNNWDGTVTVAWCPQGGYHLIRKNLVTGQEVGWSVYGNLYQDRFDLSELRKRYKYYLLNSGDISIDDAIAESDEIIPEVIVVLVRGYSISFDKAVNDNYWKADNCTGVVDVNSWFDSSNITCWEPPQGYLSGEGLCGWKSVEDNAKELKTFIDSKVTGPYANAKVNLVGHSMGGLIARKYAHDNQEHDSHKIGISNIFCIATPHAGSPLAGLKGYWDVTKASFLSAVTGLIIDIPNKATKDLTPYTLKIFNSQNPVSDNTKLYAFTSNNCQSLQNKHEYIVTSNVISLYNEFSNNGEKSDGAVPYRSALGEYYERMPVSYQSTITSTTTKEEWKTVATPVVDPMTGTSDTHLDHDTSYRHIDTLGQILKWLGFSQSSSFNSMTLKLQNETEQESHTLYYIDGFTGEFDSDHPVCQSVSIGQSTKAYFRAITSDVNCIFTITDPCGSIYNSAFAEIDPNVSYEAEDGILIYEVNSPVAGIWSLNLSTNIALPISVSYGLTAFEDQQITLSAYSNSEWINTEQPILLKAALSDKAGAITGATVSGIITLPDTTTENIILYDDGTHGDPNANDGTYSFLYSLTFFEGRYNVELHATSAISEGGGFERTAMTSFTASAADISITGTIIDQSIDINGNGKNDLLRVIVPVNVFTEKEYRLTASLIDSQGELISLINSGLVYLALDATVISTDTLAKDIVKHNVNGPYTLENIQISDGNTGLIIASAIDHNTAAYQIAQFEPLDSDGDGLSDVMELNIGTDPNKADTDEDGATDYQEISVDGNSTSYNPQTDSNPLIQDTDGDGMTDGYEINYGLNPLLDDTLDDFDGDGLTNIQEYNFHTRPDKIDTDDDGRNDTWEIEHSTNPLVYENYTRIAGDINLDASVNFADFAFLAGQWQQTPSDPSADIAPEPNGDGFVDILDLVMFAEHWLSGQ